VRACERVAKRNARRRSRFTLSDAQTRGRQERFPTAPTRVSARICAILLRPRLFLSACVSLLVLVLVVVALGGCGSSGGSSSSNGIASKTPAEILAAAMAAADSASSVHVSGSIVSAGSPITLDLELVAGKGGRGQISEGGLSFNLIQVDGTAYISGSPAFYSHFGGPAAAQLLEGKWLKAPASSGSFSTLGSLTDLNQLLNTSLSDHGALSKGPTTTIGGQQVLSVSDTSHGGTLYVATTGKPYPIEISKAGATGGRISFDDWNAPVTLEAPKDAIDLSQLESHG
jgi:hypothetical protein